MMEAASVTGPAKNLIGFCRWLSTPEGAQTGLAISIATFDRNARAYDEDGFAGAARAAGIDTHLIRERYRFDPGVLPQLRRLIATIRPDILQTHNNKSHLLVKLMPGSRAGRLWFAFQHGHTYPDLKQLLYNQVDRLTLRSADRVVSVCQAFAPRLVSYGVRSERIRVVHNAAMPAAPVAEAERAQLRSELGIRGGEAVILCIGRLSREKGHADLLRALGQLLPGTREWKLVLVGIGPERAALERVADSLGIGTRVVFAGFRSRVAAFFSIADLFVLPSHTEGSANVLLEALVARVPVVATAAGGNPEIIEHQASGLVVPVGDVCGLSGAIARLLSERELAARFVQAGAERAAREFSLERYRSLLCALYAEAFQSRAWPDSH